MLAAVVNAYVIVCPVKLYLYEKPRLNRVLERYAMTTTRGCARLPSWMCGLPLEAA